MKTKTPPAIYAGTAEQLDALAAKIGADRDYLASILLEHSLEEVEAGRLEIKPTLSAGGAR